MELLIRDQPERHRYEAVRGDQVVGTTAYRHNGDVVTFTHTEVDTSEEGQGIGSTLVKYALDDVRSRDLRVLVRCPFVKSWIERHPDYADLLG